MTKRCGIIFYKDGYCFTSGGLYSTPKRAKEIANVVTIIYESMKTVGITHAEIKEEKMPKEKDKKE